MSDNNQDNSSNNEVQSNNGGNIPQLPGQNSGNASINPLIEQELDIMDPEAEAKNLRKKSAAEVVSDIKDKAEKVKDFFNKAKSIVSAIGPWGVIIILIIIVVIGLWGFFHYMPGLTVGKLKELAQSAINFMEGLVKPTALAEVEEEDIANVANYLEEMGYDLIGYGFVTPNIAFSSITNTYEDIIDQGYNIYDDRDETGVYRYYNEAGEMYDGVYYNSLGVPIDNVTGEKVKEEYLDENGITRTAEEINSSGQGKILKIPDAQGNLLKTYLLSDYRIYTLRNDDQGLLKKIYASVSRTFGGFDGAWATGLIKLYHAENRSCYKSLGILG